MDIHFVFFFFFFFFFCLKYRLCVLVNEAVLVGTNNLCFEHKKKNINFFCKRYHDRQHNMA